MSGIAGILKRSSTDQTVINTIGQELVFDAARQYIEQINAEVTAAMTAFIEADTEGYKELYKLPGGGYMQRRGQQTSGGAVRAKGEWDVSYPLLDWDEMIAIDDIEMAYMTLPEFQRHVDTIQIRYLNTVRRSIMSALLYSDAITFKDPRHGDLVLRPLANGDGTMYPPKPDEVAESERDHYLVSGYLATAIDNTNNPYRVLVNTMHDTFGAQTGGENIVTFVNRDEMPETEALANYVEVEDKYIRSGDQTDIPVNLPTVPGVIKGRVNGTWVSEWQYIPSGYMFSLHLEEPAPLKRRFDPAVTNLPRGLDLRTTSDRYPIEMSHWRARWGVAVGNRLNGVAMQFKASGTYDNPNGFTPEV